jgi:hypothetical protein
MYALPKDVHLLIGLQDCQVWCEHANDWEDLQCGHVWTNWHHHGDRSLCDPRLVPRLEFALLDSGTTVTSPAPAGQLVTQIFLDMVWKKGAIVLMVSNVSWEGWYEGGTDDGGNRYQGDVLL